MQHVPLSMLVVQSNIHGMNKMGLLIRSARERKGWNQKQLADKIGKDSSYVSRLETGRTKETPPAEDLGSLSDVLGVTVLDMLTAAGYQLQETESEDSGSPKAHLHAVVDQYEWEWGEALTMAEMVQALMRHRNEPNVRNIPLTVVKEST